MRKLITLIVAIGLILSACGDDGAISTTSTTAVNTTTVAPTTTTPSTTTTTSTTVPETTIPETTTTSTTRPPSPFATAPQWCKRIEPIKPGEFALPDTLGDVIFERREMVFVPIRVLEMMSYTEFTIVNPDLGTFDLGYWRIRASLYEDESGEIIEGEFNVGTTFLVGDGQDQLDIAVATTKLVSNRVPLCLVGDEEADALTDGKYTLSADLVVQEVLEVGKVYVVGIPIQYDYAYPSGEECPEGFVFCPFVRGVEDYNRRVFDALISGRPEDLKDLEGWGQVLRVFVPAGWYDFSDLQGE